MKYSQTKQITRIECQSPISDVKTVKGILYFTVNLGAKGKQLWKSNGVSSILIANIRSH